MTQKTAFFLFSLAFLLGADFSLCPIVHADETAAATGEAQVHLECDHREDCHICGMYIREYIDTAGEVVPEGGKRYLYCGVACEIRALNEHFGREAAANARVTDWETHEVIPLEQATLVIGSEIIPDMIPNIIAFKESGEAEAFQQAHGGRIVPLDELITGVSYFGLTMPFRITPAAVPPEDVFAIAAGFNFMEMDGLMSGDSDMDTGRVVKQRGMAPDRMRTAAAVSKLAYSFTDDITANLDIPYLWKEMDSRTMMGPRSYENEGMGDLMLTTRWRFWRDNDFDKHLGALVRLSLPTGEFSETNRMRHNLQLGTGALGLGAGPSFSQHIGDFWFHAGVEYFYNFENSDDYRFGDQLSGGVAVHYTPSTRTMLGLELDAMRRGSNEDDRLPGDGEVLNTGRTKVSINAVLQQRIVDFGGGNLNFRALAGLPIYENVDGIQLGEEFHVMGALQWNRRF